MQLLNRKGGVLFVVRFQFFALLEWELNSQHGVEKDTEGPHVARGAIGASLCDFRCCVASSTGLRSFYISARIDGLGKTEVGQLRLAFHGIIGEHNIF